MKESKYNTWYDGKDGCKSCFNAMNTGFVELEPEAYVFFKKICSKDFQIDDQNLTDNEKTWLKGFILGGMIVEDSFDELKEIKLGFYGSNYSSFQSISATILPTLNCNLECNYCFEPKNSTTNMTPEVIDAVKQYFTNRALQSQSQNIKQFGISWFGGEPLLCKDIICELSDHFIELSEKNGLNYSAGIVTNGWFLNEETAKLLQSKKVNSAQVTLDGPKRFHDKKRVGKGRNPTFDVIVQNILAASGTLNNISIRINIDKEIAENLDELFNDIKPLAGKKNIGIYPGHLQSQSSKACQSIESSCLDVKDFASYYKPFYKGLLENGHKFAWKPKRTSHPCGATTKNSIVIQPNGDLCKCWNQVGIPEEAFENISTKKIINRDNYYNWVLYNPFEIEECKECVYFPICFGGCPANRIMPASDFLDVPKNLGKCSPIRYSLNDMIQMIYENESLHEKPRNNICDCGNK